MPSRIGRVATGLALAIGTTLTTASGVAIHNNQARAAVTPGPNPWNYTMTNADKTKDGMVITGETNSLSQIFLIKDAYGAPIFGVGHVGGATTFGDHIRLMGDLGLSVPVFDVDTHGTITLLGTAPKIVIGGQTLTPEDIAWIHNHE